MDTLSRLTPQRTLVCAWLVALFAADWNGSGRLAAAGPADALVVSTFAGRSLRGSADGAGRQAGFASPSGMAADASGNIYVADTANHTIRRISPDGVAATLAGKAGVPGSSDGVGAGARFLYPQGIAVDSFGTVFVADGGNNTIRAIAPSGEVRTIAGQPGVPGQADGVGAEAQFRNPTGLAIDGAGTLFVADSENRTIRTISPPGEVRTLAGKALEFGSDDGTGSDARFLHPVAVAVDSTGNVYVADTNATIRAIDATARVTTLAGRAGHVGIDDGIGSNARFSSPNGIAVDRIGNIYVADTPSQTIRLIQPSGVVSTLAGQAGQAGDADGPAQEARFRAPWALAVTEGGTLYIADTGNGTIRTIVAGVVSTWAGESSPGDRDGSLSDARFNFPLGIAVDESGNIYVADSSNHTIRHISPGGIVRTLAGRPGVSGHVDGPGSDARFLLPNDVAVDRDGNLYVADEGNRAIRKIAPDGTTTTLAASAEGLLNPTSAAVDASGNVYVADPGKRTIDKIAPSGGVTTFAGGPSLLPQTVDGIGTAARFEDPYRLAMDSAGFLYVADRSGTIRKISPTAEVTTLAGDSAGGRVMRDGVGRDARFVFPDAVAVDRQGNVFVVDGGSTLRLVTAEGGVTTIAGRFAVPGGVNGPGGDARFTLPGGVAVDRTGHLYITDSGNNAIRKAVSTTQLVNLSVRGRVGTDDQTPVMGFVLSEGTPKPVLVRSIGPTLTLLDVMGATADPRCQLFDDAARPLLENDDWGGSAGLPEVFAAVGAFPLDPGSKDSALFVTLPLGLYSVHTAAANDAGGVVLMEAYDADVGASSRLINLSARMYAGTDDETLVGGFVLSGVLPKAVLLRVAGPSLASVGLGASGLLRDPKITVFQGATRIAENDDWGATPELKEVFRIVGAFDFGPDADKDAALVVTLPPGVYTVHAASATPGPGVALMEIYEVP